MNNAKKQKAEAVFCAIGMIDDRIVSECAAPFYFKRKAVRHKGLIAAAVAACAALVITLSAIGAKLFTPSINNAAQPTLEQALAGAEGVAEKKAESELMLFGAACIIWQTEGESDYYVLTISSDSAVSDIKRELKRESAVIAPDAETPDIKAWISYGDGRVVSPYLKNTVGNIGYGALFDYSAEVLPSGGLAEIVGGLLPA